VREAGALLSWQMASVRDTKVLGACLKVEAAAARLYHLFAKLHRGDAGMSALWTKTAREEENHARQVEMVMLRRDRVSVVVRADPQKAERALAMLESAIGDSMLSTPDIRRALEEAISLENVLMQFHTDYAVEFTETVDQQLFRSMMAADREHVGALQAALDRLAGR
jgi:rubrerythrin